MNLAHTLKLAAAEATSLKKEHDEYEAAMKEAAKLLPKGHPARQVLLVALFGADIILSQEKKP